MFKVQKHLRGERKEPDDLHQPWESEGPQPPGRRYRPLPDRHAEAPKNTAFLGFPVAVAFGLPDEGPVPSQAGPPALGFGLYSKGNSHGPMAAHLCHCLHSSRPHSQAVRQGQVRQQPSALHDAAQVAVDPGQPWHLSPPALSFACLETCWLEKSFWLDPTGQWGSSQLQVGTRNRAKRKQTTDPAGLQLSAKKIGKSLKPSNSIFNHLDPFQNIIREFFSHTQLYMYDKGTPGDRWQPRWLLVGRQAGWTPVGWVSSGSKLCVTGVDKKGWAKHLKCSERFRLLVHWCVQFSDQWIFQSIFLHGGKGCKTTLRR